MNDISEVWMRVPKTNGRFWISNKGRLTKMAKKERHGNQTLIVSRDEIIPVVCDYQTSRMGWHVYFDGRSHFFDRDLLLADFHGVPIEHDAKVDDKARAKREASFNSAIATRTRNPCTKFNQSPIKEDT